MAGLKSMASLMSPAGSHAKLIVLIYHRVLNEKDSFYSGDVDIETFDWYMSIVSKQFNVLPLSEAVERLGKNSLPARALAITFDDGYEDNYTNALPVLKKYQLPATFFVATGFLDGGIMWNDIVIESIRATRHPTVELPFIDIDERPLNSEHDKTALIKEILGKIKYLAFDERKDIVSKIMEMLEASVPDNLMMKSSDVVKMSESGMEIGAHTVNHPILSRIELDDAEKEITQSRNLLKELTGTEITGFAYPNGRPNQDYQLEHPALLKKCGFQYAVSTAWGFANSKTDPFQLPRIGSWDNSELKFNLRMLQSYFQAPELAQRRQQ